MKTVIVRIGGKDRYLTFTGAAMFEFRDKFGSAEALLEAVEPNTRESFSTLCSAVAVLAEQGELVRRRYGYEPEKILDAEAIEQLTAPSDIIGLKLALPRAISLGYGREIEPESDEVDLGLAELSQKKTT